MTAKDYLRQAYRLNERIDSHLRELEELRSMATSIQGCSFGERIPSGTRNTEAPFVRAVIKIVDMEQRVNEEIDRLVDLKTEMNAAISKVENIDEQLLLRYRYIENMPWEEIGLTLNMSVRSVHRIHSQALQNFIVPNQNLA